MTVAATRVLWRRILVALLTLPCSDGARIVDEIRRDLDES